MNESLQHVLAYLIGVIGGLAILETIKLAIELMRESGEDND